VWTQAAALNCRKGTVATTTVPLETRLLWLCVVGIACGRTDLLAEPPLEPLPTGQTQDASLDLGCDVNGDCDMDSICIRRSCVFFGECLVDWHCGGQRRCEQNVCTGEFGEVDQGVAAEAIPCEINGDCGEHEYCVDGACRHGVECLTHAHCPPANACLGTRCVSAF
jgi:hypothetical protein